MKHLYNKDITPQLFNSISYDELEELFFDKESMYTQEESRLILLNLGSRVCDNPLNARQRCPWVRMVLVVVGLRERGFLADADEVFGVCLREVELMLD